GLMQGATVSTAAGSRPASGAGRASRPPTFGSSIAILGRSASPGHRRRSDKFGAFLCDRFRRTRRIDPTDLRLASQPDPPVLPVAAGVPFQQPDGYNAIVASEQVAHDLLVAVCLHRDPLRSETLCQEALDFLDQTAGDHLIDACMHPAVDLCAL